MGGQRGAAAGRPRARFTSGTRAMGAPTRLTNTPLARQRRGEQMPFGHLRQEAEQAGRRVVERLERCASPDAVIDAGLAPPEGAREARAVHAARPADVPRPAVLLGPLPLQHRLRPAVTDLP